MSKMVASCPLCGAVVPECQSYLANMSIAGKLVGRLPSATRCFIPSKAFKTRLEHGRKTVGIFKSKYWHHCKECGLGFAQPKFSIEELSDYYTNDFWTVRNSLELRDSVFDASNLKRPTEQLAFIRQSGLHRVDSMLDFGAGMCGAPALFKREGFCQDIAIVDPSKQAMQIADILGITRYDGLESCEKKRFDLIYSSHSLEHVTDVKQVLGAFYNLCESGGHLFIEVPNVPNKTVLTEFHHAPHTFCFSENALVKAAADSGFRLIKAQQYGDTFQSRMKVKHKDLQVPDSLMALFERKD